MEVRITQEIPTVELSNDSPTINDMQELSLEGFSGKIYDSHTFYNKHIPYYAGIGSDPPPTIQSISEF